jgi:hypothetical protein
MLKQASVPGMARALFNNDLHRLSANLQLRLEMHDLFEFNKGTPFLPWILRYECAHHMARYRSRSSVGESRGVGRAADGASNFRLHR